MQPCAAVATGLLALSCVTWYGGAPFETHSNPQVTPLHTVAPWYFYWLQGLIKIPHIIPFLPESMAVPLDKFVANLGLTPKTLWGIVIPPIIILALFAIPYIDPNPSRKYKDRKVALGIGIAFELVILYLSLGGVPTGVPTTGFGYVGANPPVEVGQEFIPDEGESLVKAIPYDQLPPGTYKITGDPGIANAPKLNEVIKSMYLLMEEKKDVRDPLGRTLDREADGTVVISNLQTNVRRFTINISYTDDQGIPQLFSKDAYIHADSGYAK